MQIQCTRLGLRSVTACVAILLAGFLATNNAIARGMIVHGTGRFVGIVHVAPLRGNGTWVIGDRTIKSSQFTVFEWYESPLAVGSCVRVEMWNEDAIKIESLKPELCFKSGH